MYNYQYSKNSLSRGFNSNLVKTDIAFHKCMIQILGKYSLIDQYKIQLEKFIVNGYLLCLKRCLFNPVNPQTYEQRVNYAIELTKTKPYRDVLNNKYIIHEHCKSNIIDRLFIFCAMHNHWRIIEFLMRIK